MRIKIGGKEFETQNEIVEVDGRIGGALHGSGTIVARYPKEKPTKAQCAGCRDDFYNHGGGGATECWSFKSAEVVDKIGHSSLHTSGGVDRRVNYTLSCWSGRRT